MRSVKPKKCKECGGNFTPFKTTQVVCGAKCATKLAEAKVWKEKKKVMIENTRTRTEWLQILQVAINKLIRQIDYGNVCISCNNIPKKPQAGHYHSTQANPTLRFNLFNIWLQCYRCNEELSANIIGYNKGLREQFSPEMQVYVEQYLVNQFQLLKLNTDKIKECLTNTRKALKEVKEEKRTQEQRIELRKYYLDFIGIYK